MKQWYALYVLLCSYDDTDAEADNDDCEDDADDDDDDGDMMMMMMMMLMMMVTAMKITYCKNKLYTYSSYTQYMALLYTITLSTPK